MSRTALLVLAALFLPPAAVYSGPRAPDSPERIVLDLEGVPGVTVPDIRRPGRAQPFAVPGSEPAWVNSLTPGPAGAGSRSGTPSAAYFEGRVLAGGGLQSMRLVALDAKTGKRLWSNRLADNGPSAVVLSRRHAVTNTESCTTYSVDPVTGRRQWSRWLGPSILTPPALTDDRVLVSYRSPRSGVELAALDAKTGRSVWTAELANYTIGAPVVALGRVFLTLLDGRAVCLSLKTGEELWSRSLRATSAPVLGAGGLYFAAVRGWKPEVVHVDPLDGQVHWRSPDAARAGDEPRPEGAGDVVTGTEPERTPLPGSTGGWAADPPRPVVVDPYVVLAAEDVLVALDAGTGEPAFRMKLPGKRRFSAPPAVLGDDLLYVTTDGLLLQLSLRVRAVRRALDLGAPVTSQPIVGGGRVFVTSGTRVIAVPWGAEDGPDYPQWGGGR